MSKIEEVRSAMMNALKAGDKETKDALSLLLSALKNKQIDKNGELTPDEENAVVYKEIKEAQETIDTTPADRTEIIDECKARIKVYEEFAPKLMSEEEIIPVIEDVLKELGITEPAPSDKGKIMKSLMPRVKGKADGKLVNEILSRYFK